MPGPPRPDIRANPEQRWSQLAGLFTLELPQSVFAGQEFNLSVPPISYPGCSSPAVPTQSRTAAASAAPSQNGGSSWRYVVGSFGIEIPVATADIVLPWEQNLLAIMKWRLQQLGPTNRWYPVLLRYIAYIEGMVDGLGGNSQEIPPSPLWFPA